MRLRNWFVLGSFGLALVSVGSAQTLLTPLDPAEVAPEDLAALSAPAGRRDLGCRVDPVKPNLQLDLRFHAGYQVSVPLKRLAGGARALHFLMRVVPVASPERVAMFAADAQTPAIAPETGGDVDFSGEFGLGPGRYRVDWLLHDGPRACSAHWNVEAKLNGPFSQSVLAIPPNTAAAVPEDPFRRSSREHDAPDSRYAKILVNIAPANPERPLSREDLRVAASILRAVARQPHFGRFSVVAFSMEEQRVIYRQSPAPVIDFPALGRAVRGVRSGVVNVREMDPGSGPQFLSSLLTAELGVPSPAPDACIVVSPKIELDRDVPSDPPALRQPAACPVFLLNYNPDPRADPWRGALSRALRKAYSAFVYTVSSPPDLGNALRDMTQRLKATR